jgi:RNase adaptor protein for sRNA GlmZ degradation
VAEIILIAGLPGSGKTTYLKALQQEGWLVFDDFKANAYNDSSVFWHSQNYEALLMVLREGQKCVVVDIDFCKTESRHEADTALREQIPDLKLNWLFFENDFEACQANVRRRASRSIEDNLRAVNEYHALYRIPIGAQVISVWRPDSP